MIRIKYVLWKKGYKTYECKELTDEIKFDGGCAWFKAAGRGYAVELDKIISITAA